MTKTINQSINPSTVETMARQCTLATLKCIYSASGEQAIYNLYIGLIKDFNTLDNGKSDNITDGYDLFLTAYSYLYNEIINNGKQADDVITITLKSGKTKDLTIFQNACREVRKEIYKHSGDNPSTALYINDFSTVNDNGDFETTAETLNRLIKVPKYYDIADYTDYSDYTDILSTLKPLLSDRQLDILNKRLQGLSTIDIGKRLNVSQQAVSKQLLAIQNIIAVEYPEKVRGFKAKRIFK